MAERPSVAEICMAEARLVALRSTCPRARVGAVITQGEGYTVSRGYNGAPPGMPHCSEVGCEPSGRGGGCGRATHAEKNAIGFAARRGIGTEGATLWITHGPCEECAQLILAAGIAEVRFQIPYRLAAGRELLEAGGVLVARELALEPEPLVRAGGADGAGHRCG